MKTVLKIDGHVSERVEINGWQYVRVTDRTVNAWHDVVEHHFDLLCEEPTEFGLAASIFLLDELLTQGEAREQVQEALEYNEGVEQARREGLKAYKGY